MRYRPVAILLIALGSAVCGQEKIREKPGPLTLACGSRVAWRESVEQALAEAEAEQRPVFWYIPTSSGSKMDRKDLIDLYMLSGPFQDREVEALLNSRFIPVRQIAAGGLQNRYNLRQLDFVEPGFLVLKPDGSSIKRVDRITTLSSPWFLFQLREALSRAPELDRDSARLAELRKTGDGPAILGALMDEGAIGEARAMVRKDPNAPPPLKARLGRLAGDRELADAAHDEWAKSADGNSPEAAAERLRWLLWRGDREQAAEIARRRKPSASEAEDAAEFLGAVARLLSGEQKAARKTWERLAKTGRSNRWTEKASAEFQRLGPTSRAFECWEGLPDDAFQAEPAGTCTPRNRASLPWICERSIALLLAHQREDGAWDDSNYDYGGTTSLPNVYAAGTALAGKALLDWRHVRPDAIDAAVDRACAYLLDERHIAQEDPNELIWAHAYRLIFFDAYLAQTSKRAEAVRRKCREIARDLAGSQLRTGAWRHEYPNPFATATVIHAWKSVEAGARVPMGRDTMDKAARAMLLCRGEDGSFTYGLSRGGGSSTPLPFAAGRMPLCELALLLLGHSDQEKLGRAIVRSFEYHEHMERVRKVDDHADRYGNGGFFFWYNLHGRSAAIGAIEDSELRARMQSQMADLILGLTEIDGAFVDSHELGRTYGTAMALICLAQALEDRQ